MNITTLASAAGSALMDIPNPTPIAPPGSEGLTLILGWAAWIIFGVAVLAIIIVAGKMMIDNNRGRGGGEAASGLVWVLIGCIIAAVASGIIGAVVGAVQA